MKKYLNKDNFARVCAFFWPFLFLLPYVVSGMEWSRMVVLDMHDFYYPKVYLLNSLAEGRFPLWSPAEGAGFPFYTSPFNQAMYPFNFLLAIYYKITGGFSWFDYQRYTILGISMFGVFLYNLLRRFKIDWKSALLATLIISVSFKTLGMLNRASAEHGLAWMTALMWGMTIMASAGERKKAFFIISLSFFMFVTNLYPYYLYYSVFLLAFLFVLIIIPRTRWQLIGVKSLHAGKYLLLLIASFGLPLLVCLPYLWQVKTMQSLVTARTGGGAAYVKQGGFSFIDSLGALLYPPCSNSLGWYFFGSVCFLLISFYLSSFAWHKRQEPKLLIGIFSVFAVVVSMVTYSESFWFEWLMNYVPGFGNFKSWSRFNVLLLPFIAYLLARAFRYFIGLLQNFKAESIKDKRLFAKSIMALLLMGVAALSTQFYLHVNVDNSYLWKLLLAPQIPNFNALVYPAVLGVSLVALLLFITLGRFTRATTGRTFEWVFLLFLVINASLDVRYHAVELRSLVSLGPFENDVHTENNHLEIEEILLNSFETPRVYDPYHTFNIVWLFQKDAPSFSARPGMSWWFGSYQRLAMANSEVIPRPMWKKLLIFRERMKQLMGMNDGKKIFLAPHLDYKLEEVNAFLDETKRKEKQARFTYEIEEYNGDYLKLKVESLSKGNLCFIDNHAPWWYAKIDGEEVPINRLFETFKSVEIDRGISTVEFYFSPPFFGRFRAQPKISRSSATFSREEAQASFDQLAIEINRKPNWQNIFGLEESEGKLVNAEQVAWGYAGASSKQMALSKDDAAIGFKIEEFNKGTIVGFSEEDADFHYQSMLVGVLVSAKGELQVFEGGKNQKVFEDFQLGDEVQISRIKGHFICSLNGKVIFESQQTHEGLMFIDASLVRKGASVSNVKSSF